MRRREIITSLTCTRLERWRKSTSGRRRFLHSSVGRQIFRLIPRDLSLSLPIASSWPGDIYLFGPTRLERVLPPHTVHAARRSRPAPGPPPAGSQPMPAPLSLFKARNSEEKSTLNPRFFIKSLFIAAITR